MSHVASKPIIHAFQTWHQCYFRRNRWQRHRDLVDKDYVTKNVLSTKIKLQGESSSGSCKEDKLYILIRVEANPKLVSPYIQHWILALSVRKQRQKTKYQQKDDVN